MHLRTTRRIRQEVKLYDPIGADREGNEISLMDILSSEQDEVLDADVLNIDRDRLAEHFHCLSPRERTVLGCVLELGRGKLTQAADRQELGISRSYVPPLKSGRWANYCMQWAVLGPIAYFLQTGSMVNKWTSFEVEAAH